MYSVRIRDHIMIAHSSQGEVFGPAQQLHSATYFVDAEFQSPTLDKNNIIIDIGLATDLLKQAQSPLKFQNLDSMETFKDPVTTTEFLAKHIHEKLSETVKSFFSSSLKITLGESHVA